MAPYHKLDIKKYYLWIGLIFAFALRIGFSLNTNIMAFGDAVDYNNAAIQVLKNYTYPKEGVLLFFRPPLYALFLSVLYKVSFQNFLLVKITQALIGTLTCYFIMRIGQKIFDKRTGYIAFILAAVNPFFIRWTGLLQTETLFMFLFIVSIFLLVLFDRTNLKRYLLLSAFFLALSALTRPVTVLFLPFLFIYFFLRHKRNYIGSIKNIAMYILCFFCIIAPWSLRNYKVYNEFILINNAGGLAFYAGNNKFLAELLASKTKEEYQHHTKEFVGLFNNLSYEMKNLSNSEMQKKMYKASFDYIKNNPKEWAYVRWRNFLEFWRPSVNPWTYSKSIFICSFIYLFPIIFLGLFEIVRQFLVKEISMLDRLLIGMVLIFGSSQALITESMIRYRIPIIDPFLIIFASHMFCFLICRLVFLKKRLFCSHIKVKE